MAKYFIKEFQVKKLWGYRNMKISFNLALPVLILTGLINIFLLPTFRAKLRPLLLLRFSGFSLSSLKIAFLIKFRSILFPFWLRYNYTKIFQPTSLFLIYFELSFNKWHLPYIIIILVSPVEKQVTSLVKSKILLVI